jgi:DNA-directed RNA polymerase specialized sigma24 family protein
MPLFVMSAEDSQTKTTLGDLLYARAQARVPEQDWCKLIQSIAAGDELALHARYERAHRIVFTLIMRLTGNRETAEELTIDVFHDVWRRAARYEAASGTVLGWIMNQARSRAIDRLRMPGSKSCTSSTASCGSTSTSFFRVTTITVHRERATSGCGARPAAPASSSPIPTTFCADQVCRAKAPGEQHDCLSMLPAR